jgi:uncharacterized protein YcfJ
LAASSADVGGRKRDSCHRARTDRHAGHFIGFTPIGAVAVGVLAHIYGGRGALVAGFAGCIVAVTAGALIFWHTNTNHRNTKDMRK